MKHETTWTLCKIMGIPVRLNFSVVLLVLFVIYNQFSFRSPLGSLLDGAFFAGVLLLSILLHELAHSAVAIAFGGRVRDITLQFVGGCAMITRMPQRPWQEWLMAFAGPLCSLLLAVLSGWLAFLFPTCVVHGCIVYDEPNDWLFSVALLNFCLAVFNLLPAFPMDGGRMLRSFLQIFGKSKVRATEIAVLVGRGFAILWVLIPILRLFSIDFVPENASGLSAFIWMIVAGDGDVIRLLIAMMIWFSGKRELDYVRAEAEVYGGWR